jgi:hypothetical protein
MNILQKLINDTSTSENAFAEMVGVSKQRLRAQLKSDNTLLYAVKYAQQLNLKEISGDYAGSFVIINLKQNVL